MTSQDQKAEKGSQAIQSGRDTIIHHGVSTEQIKEIVEITAAAQLQILTKVAEKVVNERFADFQKSLLSLAHTPDGIRREAFTDPDFIYLLGRAQHAYARSGDVQLRDTLVDLIARRSKEVDRTRLSLSLNEAVEIAAVLTKNEFAELSAVYLIRYTRNQGINNLQAFANFLQHSFIPLLPDISREHSSYLYLEAQSCAKIENFSVFDLLQAFRSNYAGVLVKGFDRAALESQLPEGKKNALDGLLMPCLNDPSKLQFCVLNRMVFEEKAASSGLEKGELTNAYNLFENTVLTQQEIIERLSPAVPDIELAFDLWTNTPLKNLTLTTVGIAIAHANLVHVAGFEADLAVWIK
jgi:hypothetical protein